MRPSWFLVSTLTALAAADEAGTTVINYFGVADPVNGFALGDYTSTVARVVAIGKYATTYEIACLKDASQCGLHHPATIVQGPTTYSASIEVTESTGGAEAVATGIEQCSFTRVSESVVCMWSVAYTASQGDITISDSFSSTQSIPASSVSYHPLTVTDGVYALTGDATASVSGVKVTPTASGMKVTPTASDVKVTTTASSGDAAASASGVKVNPTVSSGAAAGAAKPLITAAPLGAAALAAFAAMI
ncbi:hypothetical protein N7447_007475 [Penicillium robsamsonii]|uniref:uncharacterized protein n=1 Tax=Penicillium robsamsonii TaxID=1792511 RepID=UPI0025473229|nr:uncharacterized protein N7447_010770 [Penicillium robsamsonii]XP_057086827.1 uncharacterized protein N7447_007475 [Penicillium robsamsonii]KAJ5811254.1 hypothetical protein N7447_010770 [Penicillium robsamsonii]KAJ5825135.1 hypothetical protein N7447_007475 [Penicillium robsamsonii]